MTICMLWYVFVRLGFLNVAKLTLFILDTYINSKLFFSDVQLRPFFISAVLEQEKI